MITSRLIEKISSLASWLGVVAAIIAVTSYTFYQKDMAVRIEHTAVTQRDVALSIEQALMASKEHIQKLREETTKLSSETTKKFENIKEQQQRLLLLASTQNMDPSSQKEFVDLVTKRVVEKISEDNKPNELQMRIKIIEDIVVQNPEKALQIPFLKRDISSITASIQSIHETLKTVDDSLDEIKVYKSQVESLTNQVNQTNNWMIGIFGALGVSVLGLLIGNVFHQRKAQS